MRHGPACTCPECLGHDPLHDREPMKSYRTLIRIVGKSEGTMDVVIPGWNPYVTLSIPTEGLPEDILALTPVTRCHARVNIGVREKEALVITDWEDQ